MITSTAATRSAAVVGASGYLGGELLRLLLTHPDFDVVAATSRRLVGRRVDSVHPNLRGWTSLTFSSDTAIPTCDVVFTARPADAGLDEPERFAATAPVVIDLSPDFRLCDPALYERHYGRQHPNPQSLAGWVTGLPELYRAELGTADRIATPGCMATAAVLALRPLTEHGMIVGPVDVDARTGSSGSGRSANHADSHAERSGALRLYAPVTHRHEAEIAQAVGVDVRMGVTGVEAVRGVQVLCRAKLADQVDERDIRAAYEACYAHEPFVRVLARRRGDHRYPEPKLLSGTNYCDVGFAVDVERERVVAIGALDNLVKGGSGNAVQSANTRFGLVETAGLRFAGLHPS